MATTYAQAAIYYEEDAFVEAPARAARGGMPATGPMGRQVAGKEFLSAYIRHTQAEEFCVLVPDVLSKNTLIKLCSEAGESSAPRKLKVITIKAFHRELLDRPSPIKVIHYPAPLDAKFAWARQYGGGAAFALSGITHTLSTQRVMPFLCDMVTAPFESFDAMICISRAAVSTLRMITDNYCEYLRERSGGHPVFRPRLVNIPLGVDTEKFRPPTPQERADERKKLNIADDEIVILYLGRLLHHGKVHPFPIYQGALAAAKATGAKVRLVFAGWSPSQRVMDAFVKGAESFAPGISTIFVDGRNEEVRYKIWWTADIFAFPTDNIQETFPQSVIEAMSCGLPVVASDWDGCRDQVIHGETGFLAPSYMIRGATADATSKLIVGEYRYDEFLARCNQTVTVDLQEIVKAFATLFAKPELRAQMGRAGRNRALSEFSWEHIVRRYEALWAEQEQERQRFIQTLGNRKSGSIAPAFFPPPEDSFGSYPARFLDMSLKVQTGPDAIKRIDVCFRHPLTGYGKSWRCADPNILRTILAAAANPTPLAELERLFVEAAVDRIVAVNSITWMMKYGVLELV